MVINKKDTTEVRVTDEVQLLIPTRSHKKIFSTELWSDNALVNHVPTSMALHMAVQQTKAYSEREPEDSR